MPALKLIAVGLAPGHMTRARKRHLAAVVGVGLTVAAAIVLLIGSKDSGSDFGRVDLESLGNLIPCFCGFVGNLGDLGPML
jgi:hypothetical protein